MALRRTSGSVVCPSCGSLVGVNDERCYICGRANPGLWGFGPLLRQLGTDIGIVPIVAGVSGLMFLLTLLASGGIGGGGGINLLSPNTAVLIAFGASGGGPVFIAGNWWSLLTASWLHGGLLHILFNMMAVRSLAPLSMDLLGPARTIAIYILSGVAGFLLTSVVNRYFPYLPFLSGGYITVGASASVCGLIGAIANYGQRSGSSVIRGHTSQWGLMLVVSGVLLPGVDNVAHLGGFLGGYLLTRYFNPLMHERGDHMLLALGCVAATLLALVYALWHGLRLIAG